MADLSAPVWGHAVFDPTAQQTLVNNDGFDHEAVPMEDTDGLECETCHKEVIAEPVEMSPTEAYAYIEDWISNHTEVCITPIHKAYLYYAMTTVWKAVEHEVTT